VHRRAPTRAAHAAALEEELEPSRVRRQTVSERAAVARAGNRRARGIEQCLPRIIGAQGAAAHFRGFEPHRPDALDQPREQRRVESEKHPRGTQAQTRRSRGRVGQPHELYVGGERARLGHGLDRAPSTGLALDLHLEPAERAADRGGAVAGPGVSALERCEHRAGRWPWGPPSPMPRGASI
jgi:hypothetical protein